MMIASREKKASASSATIVTVLLILGSQCGCGPGPTPTPIPVPVPVPIPTPTPPPVSTAPQFPSSFPAQVTVVNAPPYACGPIGPATSTIMGELNAFWQSSSAACSCQEDFAACRGNAWAGGILYGYIYYDADTLNQMAANNGVLAANLFLAHEFGHNIQTRLNLPSSQGKYKELQADCLAGFFAGFQIQKGVANQTTLAGAFRNSCQIGDPNFSPWWSPGAHGTCAERVAALDGGIRGYLSGALPLDACPSL